MQPPSRFARVSRFTAHFLLACFIAVCGFLLIKHRYPDFVLAYNYVVSHMWEDISGQPAADPEDPRNIAFRDILDLKRMLMSIDQAERVAAIRALGEKGDMSVFSQLVLLLNDRSPIADQASASTKTFSDVAHEALSRMLEKSVAREPANLGVLLPYFSIASKGSPMEREAMIDLLTSAGEPLAVPLLQAMSQSDQDPLHEKARQAAIRIGSTKVSEGYLDIRARIREILIGAGLLGLALGILLLVHLFRGRLDKLFGLRLMGFMILTGLMGILVVEVERGRADQEAIVNALTTRDIMALRTANYHDSTSFPGRSIVAQRLVRLGNLETLRILREWAGVEPDDFAFVKDMLVQRAEWIAARIVISRTKTEFETFLKDADVKTRKYVTELLSRLKVKTDDIETVLNNLSHDDDAEVRHTAVQSLKKLNTYPVWSYPLARVSP